MNSLKYAIGLAAVLLLAGPAGASAQSFGIGPHLSFIREHTPSNTPADRLFGGTMRFSRSRHLGVELSMDYKSTRNEAGTERVRERPMTGSLMIFLTRRIFSPYLLGGYGMYSRTFDTLDAQGKVLTSETERKYGAHIGFGTEVFLTRHTAFFLDYRYRFVRFGDPEQGSEPIGIPGLEDRLSHRGSMWTSGLAFYF
jgi:opacity protein-like surface antigen